MRSPKVHKLRLSLLLTLSTSFLVTLPVFQLAAVETKPIVSEVSSSGAGGVEFKHDCLPGFLLSGVDGNVLTWRGAKVTSQLRGNCIEVDESGLSTNENFSYTEISGLSELGIPATLSCPKSFAVVGATVFNTTNQNYVTGIKLRCGKLPLGSEIVLTKVLGQESSSQDNLQCPANAFGVGLLVKYGEIVDSFGIRCAKIQDARQQPIRNVSLSSTEKVFPYSIELAVTDYQGGSGAGKIGISRVLDKSASGCNFSQGQISAQSSGTCSVVVTKSGDAFYGPTSITSEFTFVRSPQIIGIQSLTTNNQSTELTQQLTPQFENYLGSGKITLQVRDGTAIGCKVNELDSVINLSSTSVGTCLLSASIAADDNFDAATSSEFTFTFAPPINAELSEELNQGNQSYALYDPIEDANNVVDLQVAAFALLAILASGTAVAASRDNSPRSQHSGRREEDSKEDNSDENESSDDENRNDEGESTERESGDVASASANKLPFYKRNVGIGDTSKLWRLAHLPRTEERLLRAIEKSHRFSPVLSRVIMDGSYMRAMFSSIAFLPAIIGAYIGVMMLQDTQQNPIPASFTLVAIALCLATMDALAGLVIASTIFLGTALSGNINNLDEWMTTFGLSALFLTPALIANAVRPFRRLVGDRHGVWERLTDYALATLIGSWSVEKIVSALNGLAGLQLPITENARQLGQVVAVAIIIRLLMEDLATYLFPERLAKQEVVPNAVSPLQPWTSLIFKTIIFYLVAYQFLGFGAQLLIGTTIFVAPQLLSNLISSHEIKKLKLLWYLVPRGAPKIVIMIFVGGLFAQWAESQFTSPLQYISWSFVILAIPGLLISLFSLFAESPSWDWKSSALKSFVYRFGGIIVATLIIAMYLGTDLFAMVFQS